MLRPGALPLWQQIMYDIVLPPVGTGMCWFMSRGLSSTLGTPLSPGIKRFTRWLMWFVLIAAYLIMFSITLYAYFF
jgi:hypothetical protein